MAAAVLKRTYKAKLNAQYLSKIDDVYAVFQNNVRTNLTMTEIMRNLNALMNINLDDITSYQLPGDYEYTNNLGTMYTAKEKPKNW